MKHLPLRHEYWYTDCGDLLPADNDTGEASHVSVVLTRIIEDYKDALEIDYRVQFEYDLGYFRQFINENFTEEPPMDIAERVFLAKGIPQEQIDAMRSIINVKGIDPREFAIVHWNWIRIAGCNVECRDLYPDTLRRAEKGLREAYLAEKQEEADGNLTVAVSTFRGRLYEAELDELAAGKIVRREHEGKIAAQAAKTQLRRMDIAEQPGCYGEVIGG